MTRTDDQMKTSPAIKCMKFLLTCFNIIFFLSGAAILGVGIWFIVSLHSYLEIADLYKPVATYVLIGIGAGILIFATLGCVCTIKGKYGFPLYMYCVLLVVVFLAELAAGISLFVFKKEITSHLQTGLNDTVMARYGDRKDAMDTVQKKLECCGSQDYTDWFASNWQGNVTKKNDVPGSCCRSGDSCRTQDLPTTPNNATDEIYTEGCYTKVDDFLKSNYSMIGGIAIGFSFVQLLGALLACCLGRNINKTKYDQVA